MHGCGNDYVIVDCFDQKITNPSEISKFISNRHFGIGSDGLILIERSEHADAKMRIFNADGSEALMCGNGIRCVGKYIFDHNIKRESKLSIETLSGIKYVTITSNDKFAHELSVSMGKPLILEKDKPLLSKKFFGTIVSIGNPHCVIFERNIKNLDLSIIGPLIEKNSNIKGGVNVEFVEIINPTELKSRVWERGSKETLACGTGACAATVVATEKGLISKNKPISVHLRGGTLKINYINDNVQMTGSAYDVFTGQFTYQ